MNEKLRLIIDTSEPFAYRCSLCGQIFLLPEDRPPKEGAAELVAAFHEHVRTEHPDVENPEEQESA